MKSKITIKAAQEFLESIGIPSDATWGMFDIDKILVEFTQQQVKSLNTNIITDMLVCPNCGTELQIMITEMTNSDLLNALKERAEKLAEKQ